VNTVGWTVRNDAVERPSTIVMLSCHIFGIGMRFKRESFQYNLGTCCSNSRRKRAAGVAEEVARPPTVVRQPPREYAIANVDNGASLPGGIFCIT